MARIMIQRQPTGSMMLGIFSLLGLFHLSEAGVINLSYGKQSTHGEYQGDGGQATAASFNNPNACWLNSNGEAYIVDQANKRIRKVDTSGIINNYFGSGDDMVSGDGGAATSAGGLPGYVTGDTAGNIYYSEDMRKVVRKIDSFQIIDNFAGGGSLGNGLSTTDNRAAATSSLLGSISGICTDTNGDIYVSDIHKIKKVTSEGILIYVAGTGFTHNEDISANNGDGGQATSAIVTDASGLFVDTTGMMYFTSHASGIIRKINLLSGIVVTFAGGTDGSSGYSGDGGPATSALLQKSVTDVGGDRTGRIYYSTRADSNVRVIDTSGIINRFAGSNDGTDGYSGNGGEATAALLLQPNRVFVKDSLVYITETDNNIVRSVIIIVGTSAPSEEPSNFPSFVPTTVSPSVVPSVTPTVTPSSEPSIGPTASPSLMPTAFPSVVPSVTPSVCPSVEPSIGPSFAPTLIPTIPPSIVPSLMPTLVPTLAPSNAPTTAVPTLTFCPSVSPTATPRPSLKPTASPSVRPSRAGASVSPTARPTVSPTAPIVVISFNFSLYLHNVTASSLDVTSQTAVTSSVAVTLNISTDQVSYVSQQLVGGATRTRRRRLSEASYQIMVIVNVVASTADYVDAVNQNGSYLYHRLIETLADAVESNAFTRTVREQSTTLGAVMTRYAGYVNLTVSDVIDVTPSIVDDDSDDDNAESGLSGGAIAGIVIGGVAALTIWVWLTVCRNRKRENRVGTEVSP